MPYARYFQARIAGHMHGSETVNIINFGTNEAAADTAALETLLFQLGTAILACVINSLIPAVTSDWTVEEVGVKQLHPVLTDEIIAAAPAGVNGEGGPTNVSFAAILMKNRTGGGGKRGRGRNFLPPPGDAAMTNSVMDDANANNAYAAFLTCLGNNFFSGGQNSPFDMGVLSRKVLKDTPGNFDAAFRKTTNLIIEQKVSVISSRKLGRGA